MRNAVWWKRVVAVLGWMPGWKGALLLVLLFLCFSFFFALLMG